MRRPLRMLLSMLICLASCMTWTSAEEPLSSELVFPLRKEHNHAPGIVELSNGDLLASWYRGSGERSADDVAIYGARLKQGEQKWSDDFLMADSPGFPDCNTAMLIDRQSRLWLFWPIILDNHWESALTLFRVSSDYAQSGSPKWNREGTMFLKPDDFSAEGNRAIDELLKQGGKQVQAPHVQRYVKEMRQRMKDKLHQRLGWMPRCKPIILPSGRILLPLYSDTYSFSLMAVSDDQGQSWYASKLLIGFGNIQPAVMRRRDGSLVAYMRENGITGHVRVCESRDEGITWGRVESMEFRNPGSGLDGVVLKNGNWVLIYNDLPEGRNSLAVSLSEDDGKTWKWTRHLEQHPKGSYHYPAIIQGANGVVHAIYSYFDDSKGKSMKHAAFREEWIRAGDSKPQK